MCNLVVEFAVQLTLAISLFIYLVWIVVLEAHHTIQNIIAFPSKWISSLDVNAGQVGIISHG